MEYKDISIIGNSEERRALAKYTDGYKKYIKQLREINKEFADLIEQNVGYIILHRDCRCLGAINIQVPENDSKIEIQLHLREKYFHSQYEFSDAVKEIIKSIGVYFYDKEEIEISLINNIDLSRIHPVYYHKKISDDGKVTYTCSNSRNNLLIPMLAEEMNDTEETLTELGLSWSESIENYRLMDRFGDTHIDQELNGVITLPKLFSKSKTIFWKDIDSPKSHRDISFSRDGHIELSKRKRNRNYFSSDNGTSYTFSYNILSDDFKLESKVEKDDTTEILNINENDWYTKIETNQTSLFHSKNGKRKIIRYISPKVDNISTAVKLYINEQGEIERCNIDFRVHKNNGKIKGMLAVRIAPQRDKFTINYITRGGIKYDDFLEELLENEEELISTLISGTPSAESIDELIPKVIPIFNDWAEKNGREPISPTNQVSISSIMDIEQNAVDFLKQISGEIPLPHLQDILKKYITTNDKSKNDAKRKVLK